MKRYITMFLMMMMLAVMIPFSATSAGAQTRYYNARTHRYYYAKKPNFYRRHRKAVNIGAGAAAGLVLGGLIGGRRGAGIGALAGAGGGYLVTKKQRPKHHVRYYRP